MATGQQYQGWAALPERTQGEPLITTREEAARVLVGASGMADDDPNIAAILVRGCAAGKETARTLYREAVIRNHPDTGGDPETMRRVNMAWEVLAGGNVG